MADAITRRRTDSSTRNPANGRNEVNDPSLESRVIALERQVKAMEKTSTINDHSLREERRPVLIFALFLLLPIAALLEMLMGP